MAVAERQVEEILAVIDEFVNSDRRKDFLRKLQEVEAYRRNKSYRETIDRLVRNA